MTTVPPTDIAPVDPRAPAPTPASRPAEPTSPFTALLFKEARESGMFILAVWGVVSFVVMYIYLINSTERDSNIPPFILMAPGMTSVLPVVTGILGAVLGGVALYRSQNSFDAWAFLTHRPLSRTRLFFYKTLVGLLIYAVAVGVPMLIYLWWALLEPRATPWFDWHMLLPITADFLVGIVTFLAGGLCAQRDARWYGTRLIPLLVAVVAVALTEVLPKFWMVVGVDLIFVAIFATASWGTALAHGQTGATPPIALACLRLTMVLGLLLPALVIYVLSGNWHSYLIARANAEGPHVWRYPVMLNDGTVVIQEHTYGPTSGYAAQETVRYMTLGGDPVATPVLFASAAGAVIDPSNQERSNSWNYRSLNSIITPVRGLRTGPLPVDLAQPNWYYLRPRQTVEERSENYRFRIRSLGPSGYRPGAEQPEPFPGARSSPFITPHAFYFFTADAAKGLQRIDFPDEELLNVQGSNFPPNATMRTASGHPYFVITDKHIYIYDKDFSARTAALPLKASPATRSINLYLDANNNYSLSYSATPQRTNILFELFNEHGVLLRSTEVDLRSKLFEGYVDGVARAWSPALRIQRFEVGMLLSAGMPLALTSYARFMNQNPVPTTLVGSDPLFWGIVFINVISAAVMALLLRRYPLAPPVKLLWVVAVLLLGPMLLIVFAGSYAWPVRVTCPACGKYRPVARNLCPHCAAPFSPPALNGTEIFV